MGSIKLGNKYNKAMPNFYQLKTLPILKSFRKHYTIIANWFVIKLSIADNQTIPT